MSRRPNQLKSNWEETKVSAKKQTKDQRPRDSSVQSFQGEGGDEAVVSMKKVAVHSSHRGTNYIPRALRDGAGSKPRRPPSPDYEDAEETYMHDGEEKTGMVPKRVRGRHTGGTPGRGRRGEDDEADETGAFGAGPIQQEGQYAPEGSDTEPMASPGKSRRDDGDATDKKKKKGQRSKRKVPPLAGVGEQSDHQSQISKKSKASGSQKRKRSSKRNRNEAPYESQDQEEDIAFGGSRAEKEAPKEKLKCQITMDTTKEEFEQNGGEEAFVGNIAENLGIKESQIKVTGVREGSVIVDYEITEDPSSGVSLAEIQQTQDEKLENGEMDLGAPVKSHKAKVEKSKPKKGKKGEEQDADLLADFETPAGATPGDELAGSADGEPPSPADLLIAPEPEVLPKDDDQTLVPVSYAAVKDWARRLHPRDPESGEKWSWWDADIKYVPICSGMIKKTEWVTPEAKSVGLGPVLYLYTMKAFAYLFLAFTLLNIPLFIFYVNGQGPYAKERVASGQFTDVFARLSLGNLGVTGFACSNFNLAAPHPTLRWNCPYGTMRDLFAFGMQKLDNQSCVKSTATFIGEGGPAENWDDLQTDCTLETGLTPEGYQAFLDLYQESCYDKYECDVEFEVPWLTPECRARFEYYARGSVHPYYAESQNWTEIHQVDQRRREPVFFGVTFCVADKIYHPGSGEEMSFSKYSFGYFISFIDITCVLLTVFMINLLEVRFREFAKIYDKRNVEMRDFTVAVENLPCDQAYGGKDILLQAYLWEHIETHLRAAFEAKHKGNKAKMKELAVERPWQIVDINFSKMDDTEQTLLGAMDKAYRTKLSLIHALGEIQNGPNAAEQEEKIQKLKEDILEQIALYREAKQEYMGIQEDRLFEKYEITKENGRSEKDKSITQAFITFRSMKGKDRCIHTFSDCEEAAKEDPSEEEKKFKDVYLTVEEALPSGAIQWQNLKYSLCCRTTITIVFWIVALFLVAVAFYLMIIFKDYNDALVMNAGLNTKCPSKPIEIHLVYEDWLKPPKQRAGYTHCYCLTALNNNGTVAGTEEEFREAGWDESQGEEGEQPPCQEWEWAYKNAFYLTILSGAMVGVLNGIVCFIFEVTGPLEKNLTHEGENRGIYNKIGMIQFLNIGALFLLSDFTLGFEDDTKKKKATIKILMGKYNDFDTLWYYDVGAKITMAMISNSLAPHGKTFSEPIVTALLRWILDRCFKKHLLKLNNLEKPPQDPKNEGDDNNAKDKSVEMDEAPGLADEQESNTGSKLGSNNGSKQEKSQRSSKRSKNKDDEMNEGGEDGGQDAPPGEAEDAKDEGEEKKEGEEAIPGPDECETKILFQDDLNRFYAGKPILLWYLYAWFFTNILIYYLYGGGMPLLYIFAFLFFSTSYLNYKYLFFSWNLTADMFNEDMPIRSIALIKWALLLHLTMTLFMYSNKKLMTPSDYTPEEHYAPKQEAASRFFSRRFDNSQTMFVAVTGIVFVAIYLFWRTLWTAMKFVLGMKKKKKEFEEEEDAGGDEEAQQFMALAKEDQSTDFYRELNMDGLKNHYLRVNKEYEQFRTMANALSYDDELLTEEQCKFLKKSLKERIQLIEDTIDIHLNAIQGLERFMDRSYMYKLQVLRANEDTLKLANDKTLRMREIMQSYHIYDAEVYYHEKSVIERLDRETLDLEVLEKDMPVVC